MAGILPFLALTVAAYYNISWAVHAFLVYSVSITAFLAGSWWGIHLTSTPAHQTPLGGLLASNALVLMSVTGLLSGSTTVALITQILIFSFLLVGERLLPPLNRAPLYYQRLRFWISVSVIGLHVVQLII